MASSEAACASFNGANRLGAISLLVLVLFNRQAADTVVELVKPNSPLVVIPGWVTCTLEARSVFVHASARVRLLDGILAGEHL